MTRLILFTNTLGHALTAEVNAWLEAHPDVCPEDVQYRMAVAADGAVYHAAAIAYPAEMERTR